MQPIDTEAPGWATWQLLRVELEGDTIGVDAVELPADPSGQVALLTLSFDRAMVGRDHEALLDMLRRWSAGTTVCQVFRTLERDGSLALFHGSESLVVTNTSP